MTTRGATAEFTPWSAAEVELISTAYKSGGIRAACAALPHRSERSLYKKARRLGLRRHRAKWSAADFELLRTLWRPDNTLAEIAEALGSTVNTVYWYSRKLNLPACPDGWEYLTTAARRTGFEAHQQLRPILAAAGVELYPVLARPTKRRGKYRGKRRTMHAVWREDVDRAVAEWMAREDAHAVAARLGVADETLARRLAAVGVDKPSGKRKGRWRVKPEDVERALGVQMVRTRGERGRYTGAVLQAGGASA